MKRFFLFIGNLAPCIVENVSFRFLCKTHSRRSEWFRTNHFSRFDKVSDKIKPHNKKQEMSQQSLRVLTFFYREPFFLQFLQSLGTCPVGAQFKVILQIWWSRSNVLIVIPLFWRAVNLQMNRTVKYEGAFSRIVGFAGKRFLFSPPPPPSTFCSRSNFRAITRLETLATQANGKGIDKERCWYWTVLDALICNDAP